jgi:superfamily I DNA/RNA helicase
LKADREFIWQIYQGYNKQLRDAGKLDFDDYAILCLREIKNDNSFSPPFTHIIVDEAQDLSKAQILTISKIVSQETRSITIIADAAQKIYKSGFTWTEVGIEVRGARTLSLKKNYRNTEAIFLAAGSLLSHDPDPSEFTEAEPARKGGKKPRIGYFKNWDEEATYLLEELNRIDYASELTVVLHRDWNGMRKVSAYLTDNGIDNEIIRETSTINFENKKVKICTLSSVKGLEFDNVFIADVNEDAIPYPQGFHDENDEVHISTERRLLYTAMTRARENLFLLSCGQPSRYLAEIDKNLIDVIGVGSTKQVSIFSTDDDLPF